MKKVYRVYQVDSFTKEKFSGNPAGVVINADGLTEQYMQKIARELNNSETAFIFSPEDASHDVNIRFFTPLKEVPICGHATIAAHYVRAVENQLASTRLLQRTKAGILPVDIVQEEEDYTIIMTQGQISFEAIAPDISREILQALGISESDIREDCPMMIASTGHSKVMIGIKNIELLHSLEPNLSMLSKLSGDIGCNGYYVFTLMHNEEPMVHGRMFAPAIGINEDPVTGNANGPLGAYLIHYGLVLHNGSDFSFTALQGEAIKRAGRIQVHVKIDRNEPVEVIIAGKAVIAFMTELIIDE